MAPKRKPRPRKLTHRQKLYAKARAHGAKHKDAAKAAGMTASRHLKGVTGVEWERRPEFQAAIEFYREQLPMEAVELNNRLASKVRSVPPDQMGKEQLRAADILSKNMGLQKAVKLEGLGEFARAMRDKNRIVIGGDGGADEADGESS